MRAFLVASAMLALVGAAAAADSRGDKTGLPTGEFPWWPSRYGADDQIGTLNEITPERVARAVDW